jgi:endonuclease YncB( thermonuclease family)
LPFNGNDVIELVHKDNRVDIIGFEGTDIDYALNLTLIRLGEVTDYKGSTTFDTFTFISYIPDVFKYLKNDTHEIKTLEDLYAGPQLEERYKNMPYIDPNNEENGAGGAVLVTNTSVADGDTAYFSAMNGFPGGSVRYFYLNTAEVDGGFVSAEPWGYVASKYNKEYLLNDSENKEIRIQSIPGSALNEGYGRNLGLVWINDYLSQFLIVAEGLTEDVPTIYEAYDLLLTYKDVPYLTFMRFAEQRAKENGWGLKGYPTNPDGEKSPDWNYQSNSKATTDPTWEPHLELPWV